ncbi:hypothetical protein ACOSQ2_032656 [Xanthoceras sorbifolium]
MNMAKNWAKLNPDFLVEICRRIKLYEYFVAFRGVCFSWRSATIEETFTNKDSQMPWLMLVAKKCTNLRDFFSISKGMRRQVTLPYQVNGSTCLSSKGWLIAIWQALSMKLVHPFSGAEIKLSHIKSFSHWQNLQTRKIYTSFIRKYALSSNPLSSSDFTLMVIHGSIGLLAYSRRGDKVWTTIETWYSRYSDIIYYEGQFYALDYCNSRIMACDVGGDDPTVAQQDANMPYELIIKYFGKLYLVESEGEFLVLSREMGEPSTIQERRHNSSYATLKFHVFKVDLSTNTWTKIKELGNRALLLGNSTSIFVEASYNSFCKSNYIYFTDDNGETYRHEGDGGGTYLGIYNFEDGSITPYFKGNISCNRLTPPIWVEQKVSIKGFLKKKKLWI